MAHYAKVNNGIVENVIVAEADFFDTFVDTSPGAWIKTSYNTQGGLHTKGGTPLRKNFAFVGSIYDHNLDAFYEAQPYPSWTLDEDTCLWIAPTEQPMDFPRYWDEPTTSWVLVTE